MMFNITSVLSNNNGDLVGHVLSALFKLHNTFRGLLLANNFFNTKKKIAIRSNIPHKTYNLKIHASYFRNKRFFNKVNIIVGCHNPYSVSAPRGLFQAQRFHHGDLITRISIVLLLFVYHFFCNVSHFSNLFTLSFFNSSLLLQLT